MFSPSGSWTTFLRSRPDLSEAWAFLYSSKRWVPGSNRFLGLNVLSLLKTCPRHSAIECVFSPEISQKNQAVISFDLGNVTFLRDGSRRASARKSSHRGSGSVSVRFLGALVFTWRAVSARKNKSHQICFLPIHHCGPNLPKGYTVYYSITRKGHDSHIKAFSRHSKKLLTTLLWVWMQRLIGVLWNNSNVLVPLPTNASLADINHLAADAVWPH